MENAQKIILEALEQYHRLQVPAGQTNPEHPSEKGLAALSVFVSQKNALLDALESLSDANSAAEIRIAHIKANKAIAQSRAS